MPAWGEVRDDDRDRWNLVAFIRHLPKLTPEEEREMERNNPGAVEDSSIQPDKSLPQEKPGIKPQAASSTTQHNKSTGK
jgi:hypothetical protein